MRMLRSCVSLQQAPGRLGAHGADPTRPTCLTCVALTATFSLQPSLSPPTCLLKRCIIEDKPLCCLSPEGDHTALSNAPVHSLMLPAPEGEGEGSHIGGKQLGVVGKSQITGLNEKAVNVKKNVQHKH